MTEENSTDILTDTSSQRTQYKDLLKYIGLFGGVHGLNMLTTLVRNKFSALFLGPAGLGIISLFMSVIAMLNSATNLGISVSGVRDLSACTESGDAQKVAKMVGVIRCWSLLSAAVGGGLSFFFAPFLSRHTFDTNFYANDFRLLSLVMILTALAAGELAILKGIRMLREVAVSTVKATILSLFLVIPMYYFFRESAIVPVMIIIASLTFLTTAFYSFRAFPYHTRIINTQNLRTGLPMVRLGISLVIAGVCGAFVEYFIRTFILDRGTVEAVGFYNAGLVMCTSYVGVIFVAIDNDFFSRLSGMHTDSRRSSELVNQQIELSVLLLAPVISGLLLLSPYVIRILYSADFEGAIPMIQGAALYMLLRGFNLPMAYILLSQGASRLYLFTELSAHLLNLLLCLGGYLWGGLFGLGMGMSVGALGEMTLLYFVVSRRFHFRFSSRLIKQTALFLSLLAILFMLINSENQYLYWLGGISETVIIAFLSLFFLDKRTGLRHILKSRFRK